MELARDEKREEEAEKRGDSGVRVSELSSSSPSGLRIMRLILDAKEKDMIVGEMSFRGFI